MGFRDTKETHQYRIEKWQKTANFGNGFKWMKMSLVSLNHIECKIKVSGYSNNDRGVLWVDEVCFWSLKEHQEKLGLVIF